MKLLASAHGSVLCTARALKSLLIRLAQARPALIPRPRGKHFVRGPFRVDTLPRARSAMGKVKVKRFRSCRQDPLAGGSSKRTRSREETFRANSIQSSPLPSGAGPTEKPPAVISKVCACLVMSAWRVKYGLEYCLHQSV